jgi:hypothetical protein
MNNDIATWKPKLAEGKTYQMNNFRVFDNDSDFKMTGHHFDGLSRYSLSKELCHFSVGKPPNL